MVIFEMECPKCGEMFFGPREGGKARGRWLGYAECDDCRARLATPKADEWASDLTSPDPRTRGDR